MNILNLLIKERRVAGIEISDTALRIAYFRPRKKSKKVSSLNSNQKELPPHELALIEKSLPVGIVEGGVVIKKEVLGKTLKELWAKARLGARYAIVSIAPDQIYSRIFSFPKSLSEARVEEAVRLAISFQLPIKTEDVHIGWEHVSGSEVATEVLISAIPKKIVEGYIQTLEYADIKMIALESHLASMARSIKLEPNTLTLVTKINPDNGATLSIFRDSTVRFSRTIPAFALAKESDLLREAEHLKNSFESEQKTPVAELPLAQVTLKDEYASYPELRALDLPSLAKWLPSVGAAIRGEIKRSEDLLASLLPVGTAEAYAYQKAVTFVAFIRTMTIGVSFFFIGAFVATYLFIFSLWQTANSATAAISIPPVSSEVAKKEVLIQKINALTSASEAILSTTPNWSILLGEIHARVVPGILVSNLSVPSTSERISIVGTAQDRNTLNQLKKSFQGSAYFTQVELPITNLEQKGDIPFLISFSLKDPTMFYYK